MSVGGHQLALPGPGNERAVTSLKGNELKKRRRRIQGKRRTSVRLKRTTPNLCRLGLGQNAELRVQFSLVERRFCVLGSTVIEPSFLGQDFLPGAAFSQRPRLTPQKLDRKGRPSYTKAVPIVDTLFHWPGVPTVPGLAQFVRHSPKTCRKHLDDASLLAQGAASLQRFALVVTRLASSASVVMVGIWPFRLCHIRSCFQPPLSPLAVVREWRYWGWVG
jgi:hypothetical protein